MSRNELNGERHLVVKATCYVLDVVYIHHTLHIIMDRSYQAENARSRPLPEAKLPWASPVVGWVTTCEPDVTICPFANLLWLAPSVSFCPFSKFCEHAWRNGQRIQDTIEVKYQQQGLRFDSPCGSAHFFLFANWEKQLGNINNAVIVHVPHTEHDLCEESVSNWWSCQSEYLHVT